MTARLTVRVADGLAAAVQPIVATMPLSLTLAEGREPADIDVVSGAPGWRDRLDATTATGGVLVLEPVGESAPAAHGHPARSVLIGTAWRHADLVPPAADEIRALLRPRALLECDAIAPPESGRADLIRSQLGLLRSLGLPARSLHVVLVDERGHEAIAELGDGIRVSLSAVRSSAASPSVHLALVDGAGSVSLRLPSGPTGRPGTLLIENEHGLRRVAAPFESTLRSALRTLRGLVARAEIRNELTGHVADAAMVAAAAG